MSISYLMLILLYPSSILNGDCWQLLFNTEDAVVTKSAIVDDEI